MDRGQAGLDVRSGDEFLHGTGDVIKAAPARRHGQFMQALA
jgi:hypothetical protein